MKKIVPILLIGLGAIGSFAWSTQQARACSLPMTDLSMRLTGKPVPAFEMVDPRSEETIRRYARSLEDGSMMVLEQKHCEIENVSVIILSLDSEPSKANEASMAAALEATETWQKWFGGTDAMAAVSSALNHPMLKTAVDAGTPAAIGADDAISARGESSEAVVSFTPLEDMGSFRSITALTVSVGGL